MTDQQTIPFNASLPTVTLTADGACFPNPGPGAWACVLRFGTAYRELSGRSSTTTTNNQMELKAILEGLRALKRPCRVTVRSDSKIALAWCGPSSFDPKSQKRKKYPEVWAMVQEYRQLATPHTINCEWVRGHAGDPDNERCDHLATTQAALEA
jgi:ribonuclease HI